MRHITIRAIALPVAAAFAVILGAGAASSHTEVTSVAGGVWCVAGDPGTNGTCTITGDGKREAI